jgi:hypothetical protein
MKSFAAATAASLATATLLGFAFAGPQQAGGKATERTFHVKLEWVRANPKIVDTLVITVDDGQVASVSRPIGRGQTLRSVSVTPHLNANGHVTLDLDVQNAGERVDRLKTRFTMEMGETKVVSASSSRDESKAKEPTEELFFVTPSL